MGKARDHSHDGGGLRALRRRDKGTDYLKLVGCLLLPCVLLIREDLGSTLVLLVIGFFILFVGGASRRWIIVTLLTLVVIVAGGLGLNSALNTWSGGDIQILKPYQMSRLLVFIDQDNPEYADDAYNLNQAEDSPSVAGGARRARAGATRRSRRAASCPRRRRTSSSASSRSSSASWARSRCSSLYLALLMAVALGDWPARRPICSAHVSSAGVMSDVAVPDTSRTSAWTWGSCPSRAFPCRS